MTSFSHTTRKIYCECFGKQGHSFVTWCVYTKFFQFLLQYVIQILILPLCCSKVLTRVKGQSGRLGPNVLRSVLLRVDVGQAGINACVTAAVVLVAWRMVSSFFRKSKQEFKFTHYNGQVFIGLQILTSQQFVSVPHKFSVLFHIFSDHIFIAILISSLI